MKTRLEILNIEIYLLLCLLSCVRFSFGINGCPRPLFPLGGGNFSPEKEFYKVNDVARYRCDANSKYTYMFENSTRVCLENGTWSGSLPYCVQRSRPSATFHLLHFEKKALFDGNENTCLHIIENNTPIIVNFENSRKFKRIALQIISNQENEHVRIEFTCDYFQSHDEFLSVHEIRDTTGGQLFVHLYTYERTKVCAEHFFTIEVEDYKNGKICEIVLFADVHSSCPRIPIPNEGTFIAYDNLRLTSFLYFDYGSVAIFNCRQGYYLKGDEIRYCAENSRWTGSNTSCEAIECSQEPPAVRNGFWPDWQNGTIYYINHTLEAVCKSGFINNDQPITSNCSDEGSWSLQSTRGQCQEISTISYNWVLLCAGVGLGIGLTIAVVIFLMKKQKKSTIEERDETQCRIDCNEKCVTLNEVRNSDYF